MGRDEAAACNEVGEEREGEGDEEREEEGVDEEEGCKERMVSDGSRYVMYTIK